MRLLLVEDDSLLGEGIRIALVQEGYAVDWVLNAFDAEEAMATVDYDGLVLDVNMPKKTGLELLRELRQRGKMLPVLLLTARDRVEQRVEGLDSGADDYLVKPFELSELHARLRAILRRQVGRATTLLTVGDIQLDTAGQTVMFKGKPVALSAREFSILRNLMENRGNIVSRQSIEEKLYDWQQEIGSNAVEVHISHLRKKFGADSIKTIRGMGYVME
jgi:two-component system response regulator QseB